MGVEFMAGAMFFAFVNLALFLIVLAAVASIMKKVYVESNKSTGADFKLHIRKEVATLVVMVLAAVFISGSAQPKLKIEPQVNRPLIEYQTDIEVEILTPAPRTDTMDGFVPLKN